MKRYCVGSKIGVHHIRIGIFEQSGRAIKTWSIDTIKGNGCKVILEALTVSVIQMLAELNIPITAVFGIGVSVPGEVDGKGIIHYSIPLGWGIVNVSTMLQSLSGLPAAVGCHRDLALLGEHWVMGTEAPANLALLIFDEIIQGSVMVKNHLIFNKNGFSGDLGNLSYLRESRHYCREFFQLPQYESPLADKLLAHMVRAMGQAIDNIECIVRLDLVLIGGGSDQGLLMLIKEMKKVIKLELRELKLGNDAELYGSVRYLLNRLEGKYLCG